MIAAPALVPDGYAPQHKAAAVRSLAAALAFTLADLRRLDPGAAEAERLRVLARLDPAVDAGDARRTEGERDAL